MNMEKHRRYKEAIGNVSPFARKVIFWSFVSLFCIHFDIYVGTAETTEAVNSMVTFFGIHFFGITKEKFWYFLLMLNLYHVVRFSFSVLKSIIIADSWTVFKNTLLVTEFDRGVSEAEIDSIDEKTKSGNMSGGIFIKKGEIKSTDPRRVAEKQRELLNQREFLLMMRRYNIMGFLEYFFSPIIFPAILSLWALLMLTIQVFC